METFPHAGAILARPADDVPRLLLARWHREHGRPEWGRFIDSQLALAVGTLPSACGADPTKPVASLCDSSMCSYCSARREEWDLFLQYAPAEGGEPPVPVAMSPGVPNLGSGSWLERPRLDGWEYPVDPGNGYLCIRRGMVAEVCCTVEEWLGAGSQLLQAMPIERVVLHNIPGLSLTVVVEDGRWRIDGQVELPKQGAWREFRGCVGDSHPRRETLVRLAWHASVAAAQGAVDLAHLYPAA